MKVKIKRFDKELPLPRYQTQRAAAFDAYAREQVEIPSQSVGYVPLNFAVALPPDHWLLLAARSSLHKKGLLLANGIGIGDEDFCGDGDEYQAALYNFSSTTVVIEKGERVVQGIVLPREKIILEEVERLEAENRGGFGSTGS